MFYVRKINKGKWSKIKSIEYVTDDFIKSELRSEDNTLSVWKLNDDYNDKDLNSIFLALGSNMEHLGTINLALIKDDFLEGLRIESVAGETPASEVNDRHCNVVYSDRNSLNVFVQAVIDAVKSDMVVCKEKGKMKELLIEALKQKKLIVKDMSPSLMKKLEG